MISLDAVSTHDVDFLLTLPNFMKLCTKGTLVRHVQSVFPSNTYPCHSSIITGVHPNKHGIIENVYTQPGNDDPDWRRHARLIRVPTLYEKAAGIGLKVCSIFYPVSCGAKIRWNFPEVPGDLSLGTRVRATLGGGNPWFILSSLLKNRTYLKHMSEPYIDDFTTHIAVDALRKRPELLLLHLLDVDEHKHRTGPRSAAVRDALRRLDDRLGQLIHAAYEYGHGDTAFIIFSDHGCRAVHTSIDPNDWLREKGLNGEDARTHSTHYKAFYHNAGGTSFLKVLDPSAAEAARAHLAEAAGRDSVRRLVSHEEMRISGLEREFIGGIEAADGYSFGHPVQGAHGYCLDHDDYQPFYLAIGRDIAQNEVTDGGCIVDICPLAARLLGIAQWPMDGVDRLTGRDFDGLIY